jgi:hypothetical protein
MSAGSSAHRELTLTCLMSMVRVPVASLARVPTHLQSPTTTSPHMVLVSALVYLPPLPSLLLCGSTVMLIECSARR